MMNFGRYILICYLMYGVKLYISHILILFSFSRKIGFLLFILILFRIAVRLRQMTGMNGQKIKERPQFLQLLEYRLKTFILGFSMKRGDILSIYNPVHLRNEFLLYTLIIP